MSDTHETFKQRALRAAKAVTLSAAFVGAAACADDGNNNSNDGWDVGGDDASDTTMDVSDTTTADTTDTTADTANDTGDTIEMDVVDSGDAVDGDASVSCSAELDNVCPETCNASNDADCCENGGGSWQPYGDTGACAVPGPFVPPAMVA
jgi:hypothetical protein